MKTDISKILKQGHAHFFAEPPKYEMAKTCFDKVVALAPQWAEGYHWLASTLDQLNRLEEAATAYRKAIRFDPKDPRARIAIGVLLARLGHMKEAIFELEGGIALKPHYAEADARLFLADAYERAKQIEKAKEQWRIVEGMDPCYPSGDKPMIEARQRLNKFKDNPANQAMHRRPSLDP